MVEKCICFGVSFERLLAIAEHEGGGLLAAHRQTGCGARCGLCLPYIQLVLQSRETRLPVMWSEDFERRGINPGRLARLERRLRERAERTEASA